MCRGRREKMRKKMQKNIQENHKLTEPLRLEKAFKINKSKYKADIAKATSNPRPQVPHLQNFASPAVPWVGEELPNPLRQAQGGTGLVCAGVGDKRQHLGTGRCPRCPMVGPAWSCKVPSHPNHHRVLCGKRLI